MKLSIIIVNWNTCRDLARCLASIYSSHLIVSSSEIEVLVVDNASTDGSLEYIREYYPQVVLLASQQNLGFAAGNNVAARQARGRYWLLLNPDAIIHENAIDTLWHYLDRHPRVAAVSPRLVNPDGSLQPSIFRIPTLLREWWRLFHLDRFYPLSEYPSSVISSSYPRQVEVLNGACLLLRPEAIDAIGLFDEDYFVYSEEVDLCDRLRRAGWQLHWLPSATVTHHGGQSTRQVADRMFIELYRNKLKFFRKRRGPLYAKLYKLILWQAAFARCVVAQVGRALPARQRGTLTEIGRQYRLLLKALPQL